MVIKYKEYLSYISQRKLFEQTKDEMCAISKLIKPTQITSMCNTCKYNGFTQAQANTINLSKFIPQKRYQLLACVLPKDTLFSG